MKHDSDNICCSCLKCQRSLRKLHKRVAETKPVVPLGSISNAIAFRAGQLLALRIRRILRRKKRE